jgi:hypothetical protein
MAALTVSQNFPFTEPYQLTKSIGLLYNLYADRLLGLNFVPQSIYDMQSNFYPTVAEKYGVPLDTRNLATKCTSHPPNLFNIANALIADWEMWCAAIASPSTRSMFISKLANWINTTPTNRAFTDLYDTQTGG